MDWEAAGAELRKKLSPAHVKARKQGGAQVSYIEGWHAIAEANRIFGHGAWHRETVDLRQLGDPREVDGKLRVEYLARVRITVDGVIRDGCGFGQGIDRDVGQAHESALKEAETDAMKRALMTFGNPFGLALYDKSRENVGDDQPAFDPNACKTRLLQGIERRKTKQQLTEFWEAEKSALATLKAAQPAEYQAVRDAFATAGKTAISDPARQAPPADERTAA
jgi:DNA repair and recombination protein RAD52